MRDTLAPASDGFIEVAGARLRYRDEGQGFPILLIHGWGLDLDMWTPQAAVWASQLRIVRFDRRGFGASSGRPSLAADARDVEQLVQQRGIGRFAIVGMSQGARVALRVARGPLRHRVACLVFDGAPFDDADAGEPEVPVERYRELWLQHGPKAFRTEWLAHPFMRLWTQERAARDLLLQMTERFPANDLRFPVATGEGEPADAANVDVDALVINGEFDTERRRAMGDELARALPRAERAIVPHAGHLPNLDNPDHYNQLVLSFIARQRDRHSST